MHVIVVEVAFTPEHHINNSVNNMKLNFPVCLRKEATSMGLAQIGVPGLIIILVIVLIVFGPKKLPEVGGAVGKTLAEFKKSTKEIMEDDESVAKKQ